MNENETTIPAFDLGNGVDRINYAIERLTNLKQRLAYLPPDVAESVTLATGADVLSTLDPEAKIVLPRVTELEDKVEALNLKLASERNEAIVARRELAQFREQVIEEVVDHPNGCREGKLAFLESIGLEWPREEIEVTITLTRDRGDDSTLERLERELTERINRYDTLFCEGIEWD